MHFLLLLVVKTQGLKRLDTNITNIIGSLIINITTSLITNIISTEKLSRLRPPSWWLELYTSSHRPTA